MPMPVEDSRLALFPYLLNDRLEVLITHCGEAAAESRIELPVEIIDVTLARASHVALRSHASDGLHKVNRKLQVQGRPICYPCNSRD